MQTETIYANPEVRCRRAAGRIAEALNQLNEPFRRNTIRWLEQCVAKPIEDVDEDLTCFFSQLNPSMRETTMTSLEFVMEEAVRQFGQG